MLSLLFCLLIGGAPQDAWAEMKSSLVLSNVQVSRYMHNCFSWLYDIQLHPKSEPLQTSMQYLIDGMLCEKSMIFPCMNNKIKSCNGNFNLKYL